MMWKENSVLVLSSAMALFISARWRVFVLIISSIAFVGVNLATAGDLQTKITSKDACLAITVKDPSYMKAVDRVTSIPLVKDWIASLNAQSRMAVGMHIDKTEFVKGQCYWSISVYEDTADRLRLWKIFRVGIGKNIILAMDDEGIYHSIKSPGH